MLDISKKQKYISSFGRILIFSAFVGLKTGIKFQLLENKIINYKFGQKFLVDRSEHILPYFTLRLRLYQK